MRLSEHPSQRCWVHKSANVLNALPKSVQAKAKEALCEIWMAETRADAQRAFDQFIDTYQDKYPKATECLEKDREELLAFFDFPGGALAELAYHQSDLNSTFATIPSSHASLERVFKPKGDAVHDVQAGSVCATQLAQVARIPGNLGK